MATDSVREDETAGVTPRWRRLSDYIDYYARRFPDREALVRNAERWTWAEAATRAKDLAIALRRSGISRGDRVAVWAPPRPEAVLTLYACAYLGAIFVGLNPRYTSSEAAFILNDSDAKAVFAIGEFDGRDYTADIQAAWRGRGPLIDIDGAVGVPFDEFRGGSINVEQCAQSSDPVALIYTSGTTGVPKGCLITHWALVHNYTCVLHERWCDPFRIVAHLPLNHLGGVGDTTALATIAGGTQVFLERFQALELYGLIEREDITYLAGTPTHFQLMLQVDDGSSFDMSSLQFVFWGGAPISPKVLDAVEAWCPRVGHDYGSTELSGPLCFIRPDDPREVKLNTIGRPIGPFRARVVDEQGWPVLRGDLGELQTPKTSFVTPGYFRRQDLSEELFTSDGWLRTGDLVVEREDGFFALVGRRTEMFKSGGYNVYPREIEQVLESHPAVAVAAVVPAPDELYSEVGHAFVCCQEGSQAKPEDLRNHCRQSLANYKIPKSFTILEAMPVLPIGKIDRRQLRQWAVNDNGKGSECSR